MSNKIVSLAFILALATCASAAMVVGVNDLPIAATDRDYQDLVVSITGAAVASATGVWQQMPILNESGSQYWNGFSADGPDENIGYWLTGTGGFSGNRDNPARSSSQFQWYGNDDGTGVPIFFTAVSSVSVTVRAAFSALSAVNIFGYRYLSDLSELHPLFVGGATGDTVTFDPTAPFEFYVESGPGAAVYSSAAFGEQHFSAFAEVDESKLPFLAVLGTFLCALACAHPRPFRRA